ncbi:hypothetical protein ES703_42309 [subsurface metagenome]
MINNPEMERQLQAAKQMETRSELAERSIWTLTRPGVP